MSSVLGSERSQAISQVSSTESSSQEPVTPRESVSSSNLDDRTNKRSTVDSQSDTEDVEGKRLREGDEGDNYSEAEEVSTYIDSSTFLKVSNEFI